MDGWISIEPHMLCIYKPLHPEYMGGDAEVTTTYVLHNNCRQTKQTDSGQWSVFKGQCSVDSD